MQNSNYARLIQAEAVYKEKIRQQEIAIAELKAKIQYYERILRQDAPAIESGEILGAEIVYPATGPVNAETIPPERWTMWHDPDGNEYDK